MWRFEAYTDGGGLHRWRLKAAEGRPVARSAETFSSASNARHSALHFRAIAPSWRYEVYAEAGSRYRWCAKAGNGHTVAISHDFFRNDGAARRAADDVKAHAGQATGL